MGQRKSRGRGNWSGSFRFSLVWFGFFIYLGRWWGGLREDVCAGEAESGGLAHFGTGANGTCGRIGWCDKTKDQGTQGLGLKAVGVGSVGCGGSWGRSTHPSLCKWQIWDACPVRREMPSSLLAIDLELRGQAPRRGGEGTPSLVLVKLWVILLRFHLCIQVTFRWSLSDSSTCITARISFLPLFGFEPCGLIIIKNNLETLTLGQDWYWWFWIWGHERMIAFTGQGMFGRRDHGFTGIPNWSVNVQMYVCREFMETVHWRKCVISIWFLVWVILRKF